MPVFRRRFGGVLVVFRRCFNGVLGRGFGGVWDAILGIEMVTFGMGFGVVLRLTLVVFWR